MGAHEVLVACIFLLFACAVAMMHFPRELCEVGTDETEAVDEELDGRSIMSRLSIAAGASVACGNIVPSRIVAAVECHRMRDVTHGAPRRSSAPAQRQIAVPVFPTDGSASLPACMWSKAVKLVEDAEG